MAQAGPDTTRAPASLKPTDPDPSWQQLRTVVRQFQDEAKFGVRVPVPSKKEGGK
jgi:hypothetical protein